MKFRKNFLIIILLLVSTASSAEEVVDVEFYSPLFCENYRKSVTYVVVSFNVDSFSKVTDIAYYTDGYPNIVGPDFYSAHRSSIHNNLFTVELRKLVGSRASDFRPQRGGQLAKCSVIVDQEWKNKIRRVGDVNIYETDNFIVECNFPLDGRGICRSSDALEQRLFLNNPWDGKKLPYGRNFRYRTWQE